MSKQHIDRYVIARDRNVVRVDFQRKPEPPAPKFPGAGALRISQSASCNGPEGSPTWLAPLHERPSAREGQFDAV